MPLRLLPLKKKKIGLPPGSLVGLDEAVAPDSLITLITYDEEHVEEHKTDAEQCGKGRNSAAVQWINIDGLGDTATLRIIGHTFRLHELTLEDILNTDQRPKFEDHDDYFFIVLKMIYILGTAGDIETEQVSCVLAKGTVISIQERPGDVFDGIRDRIRTAKGRIRKMGPDYLAYSLLDAVVDNYFTVIEQLGESIESLQAEVLQTPHPETAGKIHSLRTKTILLRRAVWPLREVLNGLLKTESNLVQPATQTFIRDVYDHSIQVMDTLETYRDMLSGLLELYLTSVNNRMNEVMKVLTIIATIFIPLSFIAGVYGMNFAFMPELGMKWGYPFALVLMAATAGLFLFYFKRKHWL